MLERIGYAQIDTIIAFLQRHTLHNVSVLSDLQRWSPRYTRITLDLVGYRYKDQVVAVSALYRDGRWMPFFTHPAAMQSLIDDHGEKRIRWIMGAQHVLDPLLISLQNRGLCWDYDEQGLRCSVDHKSWRPHVSPHVYRATEKDMDVVSHLRLAFEAEYFGTSSERVNKSWLRDLARTYIDQNTYIAKIDDLAVSMVAVEARIQQATLLGAVFTLRDYRDQGWAKAVVSAACQEHLQNTNQIILNVRTDNKPARRAYQALGFTPQSEYRMVRLRQ